MAQRQFRGRILSKLPVQFPGATSVTDIFILSIIDQIYQLLVHSDVHWDWGWFGRWVLISPTAHRLHHSANPSHYGKNLSVLTIWDRLFGTWYAGDVPVVALGVDQNIYNKSSFVMDCWKDYTQCFFEITQWVQKINQKILAELSN
ncbi:MAG: sterol desaturase family protein [Acidocella sp.]|nr:sterol desaturase family protein [Acidocella sp.]